MQEPDRFIGVLKHRVAPILYSVVTASFCLGSLMTTTQGFRSIFNFWLSLCLALGLQSAMLGASIFFARKWIGPISISCVESGVVEVGSGHDHS